MFELVEALKAGAEVLKSRSSNPISLNAGCELFIAFVTLFPHESDVSIMVHSSPCLYEKVWIVSQSFSELKTELVQQGRRYAAEAISFRDKIAESTLGFIKDDSAVGLIFPHLLHRTP